MPPFLPPLMWSLTSVPAFSCSEYTLSWASPFDAEALFLAVLLLLIQVVSEVFAFFHIVPFSQCEPVCASALQTQRCPGVMFSPSPVFAGTSTFTCFSSISAFLVFCFFGVVVFFFFFFFFFCVFFFIRRSNIPRFLDPNSKGCQLVY